MAEFESLTTSRNQVKGCNVGRRGKAKPRGERALGAEGLTVLVWQQLSSEDHGDGIFQKISLWEEGELSPWLNPRSSCPHGWAELLPVVRAAAEMMEFAPLQIRAMRNSRN